MTKSKIVPFAAAALVASAMLATAPAPAAADTVPGAPWAELAANTKAFDAVVPGIARRPSVLLETNYYVYGPGTGFNQVQLNVTLRQRNFPDAATLYLYWENRETGQTRYFNLPSGDFVNQEIDLFGDPNVGVPVQVQVPNLGTPGGASFPLFGPNGVFGQVPNGIPSATGLYQFVFEVRTANGNNVIARGNALYSWVDGAVPKSGFITQNETWTNDNVYLLTAPTNFDQGATLTIEPGTVILGDQAGTGTLIIRQGSRIIAQGTDMAPIILTSAFEVGQRAPGDWGGLVINGNAPTNQGTIPNGEGDSGPYGGDNPNDDSGILSYVRVEFAGIRFSETNELNGIAFQGVGAGTQVDHVQVHFNQDDGMEWFGGTANGKYLLVTDARDDSFDWTFGWQGKLQYVVAIQRTGFGDRVIEADNLRENPDAQPRANPMIANATMVSHEGTPDLVENAEGIRLRRGTGGNLTHFIQMLAKAEGVIVTEDETLAIIGTELQFRNSFFFGNRDGLSDNADVTAYLTGAAQNNSQENPLLPNPQGIVHPDIAPANASPARNVGALPQEFRNDPFFDNATFAGGVNPNDPWIDDGWTTFSDN